ncbi:MAG TPA: hypothetical protein VM432_00100 [Bdellovibrionales bacterium]|nr:hypothetical protein [Bdellovibrionales bacterium]
MDALSELAAAQVSAPPAVSEVGLALARQIDPRIRTLDENALITKLEDEAIRFLGEQGAVFQVMQMGGERVIHFADADPKHLLEAPLLNRFSTKLEMAYGAQVFFWAGETVRTQSDGLAGSARNGNGVTVPVLYLGANSLFSLAEPMEDSVILHELRHIRMKLDAKRGIPSPYYGMVKANKGVIPDRINPRFLGYSELLSFEEMLAFKAQAAIELIYLRAIVRRGGDAKDILAATQKVFSTIQYLYVVSHRSANAVEELWAQLERDRASATFLTENEVVTAVIPYVPSLSGKAGAAELSYSIPIVSAKTSDRADLVKALRVQVVDLGAAATFHEQQARALMIELDKYVQPDGPRIGVTEIDALTHLLAEDPPKKSKP